MVEVIIIVEEVEDQETHLLCLLHKEIMVEQEQHHIFLMVLAEVVEQLLQVRMEIQEQDQVEQEQHQVLVQHQ